MESCYDELEKGEDPNLEMMNIWDILTRANSIELTASSGSLLAIQLVGSPMPIIQYDS